MKMAEINVESIKYGFNIQGRFFNYRMDSSTSGLVVYDYSVEGNNGAIESLPINFEWD
jgi:hypothetical protein